MSDDLIKQLKSFISRVSDLEKTDEFDEDGFAKEFRELRTLGITHKEQNKFPTEEGKKDQNIKKNRYKDILPFDSTRVILSDKPDDKESDYMNANFVLGANGKHAYIASQGPLPQTVVDFWRMLWEYNIQVVVMVCQEVENAKAKCERYWGQKVNDIKKIGDFNIKLVKEIKVCDYFFTRFFSVWCGEKESEKHELTQYHYTGWLDHDIPHDFSDIILLINLMRERHSQTDESTSILIHCSAGCGRTGTICAIDYAWSVLKGGMMTDDFSLYDIILRMRAQRQSMVQTPDQYKVVHLAVKKMFEDHLELIDQHDYENIELSKTGLSEEIKPVIVNTKGNVEKNNDAAKKPRPQATDKPAVPKSLPLSKQVASKTSNVAPADKKPDVKHSKPLLSPKPVLEGGSVSLSRSNSDSRSQKSKSLDNYQNVAVDETTESRKSEPNPNKFVTRITVGQNAGIIPPKKPERSYLNTVPAQKDKKVTDKQSTGTKPSAYANQAVPEVKGKTDPQRPPAYSNQDVPVTKGKADPQSPPAYSNQDFTLTKGKTGPQKPPANSNQDKQKQKSPPYYNQILNSNKVSELSKATDNKKKKSRGTSDENAKTTIQPRSEKTSISKRAPAPLPPDNSNAINRPYEDVSASGGKDYSYAEPNSTDKWSLQGLARKFDQQAGTKPSSGVKPSSNTPLPQAYEEVDINKPITTSTPKKLNLDFGEGAYATVADDLSPPAVPVKTDGAYIYNETDDDQNGKKKLGLIGAFINKIPKPGGHKTENDPNKGAVKQRDDGAIVFNNKLILGFNKRGKRPNGPRDPIVITKYESSL